MASATYRELTGEQVQHFLERGYVVVEQALSREFADQWRSFAFERLGYDPEDSTSWAEERIHMPTMTRRRSPRWRRGRGRRSATWSAARSASRTRPTTRTATASLVERLDFHPTAPRERVVPEREARQARMLAQEKRRLGIA